MIRIHFIKLIPIDSFHLEFAFEKSKKNEKGKTVIELRRTTNRTVVWREGGWEPAGTRIRNEHVEIFFADRPFNYAPDEGEEKRLQSR